MKLTCIQTVVADEINLYSPHFKFKMVSVVMEFRTRIIQTSGITDKFPIKLVEVKILIE